MSKKKHKHHKPFPKIKNPSGTGENAFEKHVRNFEITPQSYPLEEQDGLVITSVDDLEKYQTKSTK